VKIIGKNVGKANNPTIITATDKYLAILGLNSPSIGTAIFVS
jgi:hypothetical protein